MMLLDYWFILEIYFAVVNVLAFIAIWFDKWSANVHGWRTREKTLLGLMAAGGSVGGIIAMILFHHKTKKLSFLFPLAVIVFIQVVMIIVILNQLGLISIY